MKHALLAVATLTMIASLTQSAQAKPKGGEDVTGPKILFVTSEGYTGDLVGEAGALLGMPFANGLEAADAICQYHAALSRLDGDFVAMLSSSTVSAASRLTPTVGPYRTLGGVPIASSYAGLFSTRVENALAPAVNLISQPNENEAGITVGGPGSATWTGTTPWGELDHAQGGGPSGGAPFPEKSFCNDWTDNTQPTLSGCLNSDPENTLPCGLSGNVGSTGTSWVHDEYIGCHAMLRLYCAER